jgi:hypothetical protein
MAKKESVRIKAFRARVIRHLQRQGWKVKPQARGSIVDLITTRAGGDKRAFLIKPHGHITRTEIATIHEYEETNHVGVVHVHESSERELLFSRMYKHLSRAGGENLK